MALTAGTRLGPYEIAAQIGVGGMGEVYQVRDTKLNRDAAIKVATPAMTQAGMILGAEAYMAPPVSGPRCLAARRCSSNPPTREEG